MRKQLLQAMAVGTACCVMTVQAQQSPGSSAGSSTSRSQDQTQGSAGQRYSPGAGQSQAGQGITSGQQSSGLSATGRMGQQQHVKASQLEGSQVTSSSGQNLGTIKDAIINPSSGRIEFAILSVNSSAGTVGGTNATRPGSTTTTTPGSTTTTTPGLSSSTGSSLTGGKEVAVPWMLLRSSSGATASTAVGSTRTSGEHEMSFVFSGDASKLQNAPAFNDSTDLSQPNWRQSVYSHYGLTSGAATGGGTYSPGGRSTGTSGLGTGSATQHDTDNDNDNDRSSSSSGSSTTPPSSSGSSTR